MQQQFPHFSRFLAIGPNMELKFDKARIGCSKFKETSCLDFYCKLTKSIEDCISGKHYPNFAWYVPNLDSINNNSLSVSCLILFWFLSVIFSETRSHLKAAG